MTADTHTMATPFFSSWQLWQKLIFCLACAIVIVVSLGCAKLFYTHRTLRGLSKLADEERRDKEEHIQQTEMLQNQSLAVSDSKTDAHFGIRALQSGVEVEGVWISPSSTPKRSSFTTSAGSSTREKPLSLDPDIDTSKEVVTEAHVRSVSHSTIGTARTHDRAISLGRTSRRRSRSSSPGDTLISRPCRSRHPPSSYVRYSCNPYLLRQSTSLSTFEGLEAIHNASITNDSCNEDDDTSNSDSSNRSSDSGNDVESIVASAPGLFLSQPPRPRPRMRPRHHTSQDIELLNRHRTSQAAEIGQLAPRARREERETWSQARMPRVSTSDSNLDYLNSLRQSRPTSSAQSPAWNVIIPQVESTMPTARRSSLPDVTPFTEFCQNAPLPNSRPSSSDSGVGGNRDSSGVSIYKTPHSSPVMLVSEGAADMALLPAMRTSPPRRKSFDLMAEQAKVLRGHGSGFEILKPGSLNPKLPDAVVTQDSMEKKRSTPPVSLHNSARPHSRQPSSSESTRKLQKKRRSRASPGSLDSTSTDETRRSRISGIFS